MAEATVYLELEPIWSSWQKDDYGQPRLSGMQVVKMLKNRPTKPAGAVIRLKLKVPDGVFLPLRPTITVEVPESAVDVAPVVTVELPDVEP